ncbi:hypothetical protein ACVWY3_006737 [Bradyrhizobium sp. USDA 4486]
MRSAPGPVKLQIANLPMWDLITDVASRYLKG